MADQFLGSVYATLELRNVDAFKAQVASVASSAQKVKSEVENVTFDSLSKNASSAFGNVAGGITTLLKPLIGIGGAGALGFGSLITYAFNATREVQGYTAGIKGLTDNSADASKIIKDMVDYVQGKPFDRLDTLQAARNLLAYGESAKDVKGSIEAIGKAVIVSNVPFGELSTIYGQVISQGKLTTESFDELALRGINLSDVLGKQLGIASGDVRASLADGSVSADQFRVAMSNAFPDKVVTAASNTIDQQVSTLKASFRNLGFSILGVDFNKLDDNGQPLVKPGGLLDTMNHLTSDLIKLLKDPAIQASFANLGKTFADFASTALPVVVNGFKFLAANFGTIVDVIGALIGTFVALKAIMALIAVAQFVNNFVKLVSALRAAAGAQATFNVLAAANPLGLIAIAIAAVIGVLIFLQLKFDIFGKALEGIKIAAGAVGDFFVATFNIVKDAVGTAINYVQDVVGKVGAFFVDVFNKVKVPLAIIFGVLFAPILLPIAAVVLVITHLGDIIHFLGDIFSTVFNAISAVVSTVFGVIAAIWNATLKPVFDAIVFVVVSLAKIWFDIWSGIAQVLFIVVSTIVQIIGVILYGIVLFIYNQILVPIGNFFAAVWNGIVTAVTIAVNFISGVINTVFTAVRDFIVTVFTAISGFIVGVWQGIYNFVAPIVQAVVDFLMQRFENAKNNLIYVFNLIKDFVVGVWQSIYNAISSAVNQVLSVVGNVLGNVAGKVSDALTSAYNTAKGFVGSFLQAGKDMIQGIVNGVAAGKDAVVNKVKDIAKGALDAVKSFFGIHSPSTVMAKTFGYVMQGAELGISRNAQSLQDTFANATQLLPSANDLQYSLGGAYGANAASGLTAGGSVNNGGSVSVGQVNIQTRQDDSRFLQMITRNTDLANVGMISAGT